MIARLTIVTDIIKHARLSKLKINIVSLLDLETGKVSHPNSLRITNGKPWSTF